MRPKPWCSPPGPQHLPRGLGEGREIVTKLHGPCWDSRWHCVFVLQDDYIPYPSIDEVGAPWILSRGQGWGS